MQKSLTATALIITLTLYGFNAYASTMKGMDGSFAWQPRDKFLATNVTKDFYICQSGYMITKHQNDIFKQLGLTSIDKEPEYKEGKCSYVTETKTCKYPTHTCYAFYNNGSFVDIYLCKIDKYQYQLLKGRGATDEQLEQSFSASKIKSDFTSGRCGS